MSMSESTDSSVRSLPLTRMHDEVPHRGRPPVRRIAGSSILIALIVAVAGLMLAASASAEEVNILTKRLGVGELSLTEQSGVGVNQEAGTVYVSDTGHDRVAKFASDGTKLADLATASEPTFLAVDNSPGASHGDVYLVEGGNKVLSKLDALGTPVPTWGTSGRLEGLGEIVGISVDPAGNLFVLNVEGKLRELAPGGSQESECTAHSLPSKASGLAATGKGDLYYIRADGPGVNPGTVAKITSACAAVSEAFASGTKGIAVNEADETVIVSEPGGISSQLAHLASDGTRIGPQIGSGEGAAEGSQLAVDKSNETIYVSHSGYEHEEPRTKFDVAVFTKVEIKPPFVEIKPPTSITGTTAVLHATIDPEAPENNPPPYDVEYRFVCIPGCSGSKLAGSVNASSVSQPVQGTAEHLLPGTKYKVFVTGKNRGGTSRSSEEEFSTSIIAPSIEETHVSAASESTVTIAGIINPGGTETSYRVQYLTRPQFEASGFANAQETPAGVAVGGEGVPVSVLVTGLSPSTSYVARFVASNEVGPATGEEEVVAFMTREVSLLPPSGCLNELFRRVGEPSALLPDCRAYERATPADKNGGGVEGVAGAVQAAEAPDSITFFSQAGIPGGVGAQDYPTFISSRGEESWNTQGLLPPQSIGRRAVYLGLTPGGRYALTAAVTTNADGETLGVGLFRRDLRDGAITTLDPYDTESAASPTPCVVETITACFTLAGASSDGSRIFIESNLRLTKGVLGEETILGQPNLFVWEEGSGKFSLVDRNEAGEPLPEGAFAGAYDWFEPVEEPLAGGPSQHMYAAAINAISVDGSKAFYTERAEAGDGQLFVRQGIGGPAPSSVKVSAYAAGREGPELPATFLEATPDGRYVFFKSRAELTSDSYAGESGSQTQSLFRYDCSTGKLINVTSSAKQKQKNGPGVEGILGTSESGKVVYFVADAALTTKPGPRGSPAVAGEANLYRWIEGSSQPISFIAPLNGGKVGTSGETDSRDWSPMVETEGGVSAAKTARVSADGNAVFFSSHRALTGAPNQSLNCSGVRDECAEFFRYAASAQNGTLSCVSCDPTGASPLGSALIGTAYIEAEDPPERKATPVLSRNLSTDGNRFFFETPNPLVASDDNGAVSCSFKDDEHATCMDVYEWEAPGVGTCPVTTTSVSGGCVYLISSGQSDQASYFADADREGKNVYFFTTSQLVPVDTDHLFDVYDAREGGGLAAQHETPVPPCRTREACQAQRVAAEPASTPGSSTFVGPQNLAAPKPCKKGQVRKHGKCVKKPKKQHHKKKGHKKKGHKKKGHKKKRAGGGAGGKK
jgi:hypothetical protein